LARTVEPVSGCDVSSAERHDRDACRGDAVEHGEAESWSPRELWVAAGDERVECAAGEVGACAGGDDADQVLDD
jgi:hypothetical protein